MAEPAAPALRERLALALDVSDLVTARRLAGLLSPIIGVAKVGLELYSAAGPEAVAVLLDEGLEVFVDLKFFDIPTTVRRAAMVVGSLGARYATVHTAGGRVMVEAAVEGLSEGAARAGKPDGAICVGVTVLTSEQDAKPAVIEERADLALRSGCGALVCAAPDLPLVKRAAPGLLYVVPGTRPPRVSNDDQARVATPAEAMRDGAGLLVVGRAVTAAVDPLAAAESFVASLGTVDKPSGGH